MNNPPLKPILNQKKTLICCNKPMIWRAYDNTHWCSVCQKTIHKQEHLK